MTLFAYPYWMRRYPTAICYGCGQLIENIAHHTADPLWQHTTSRFVECAGRPGHYACPLGGAS